MADKEAGGSDTGPRETAPTSAYSSPARSLGDTGITPLSPSHVVWVHSWAGWNHLGCLPESQAWLPP
uniref:Heat shock protein family A (Hsp70) member 12A n=1 Tax=Equus asinus TaxID=9793 RepID=A0A9L0JEK4_EQUAS